jgi:hypothetical protein
MCYLHHNGFLIFEQRLSSFFVYSWLQKKTGIENVPNVNLVLSICQLIDNTYQIIFKNVIEF